MDYLRHGTSGARSIPTGSNMRGCKYRQRTGACSCDNPPIGCMEPEDRPARTSKPDATSATHPGHDAIASAPPPPLPSHFPVFGSDKQVPAVGWRCDGKEDAADAMKAGLMLIDACGNAEAEAALSSDASAAVLLATALPALHDLKDGCAALAAAKAAGDRIGRQCSDLLLHTEWPAKSGAIDDADVALWKSIAEPLKANVGLLAVSFASAQMASELLRKLQMNCSEAMPHVAMFPTNPCEPHRALLGVCRRLSVLPVSTSPLTAVPSGLGGADGQSVPSSACRSCLSWSAARGVPALICGKDAQLLHAESASLISSLDKPLSRLDSQDTAALNALG